MSKRSNPINRTLPLYNPKEKALYTKFFEIVLVIVIVCGIYTKFNPFEIFMNSGYFWSFILDDFLDFWKHSKVYGLRLRWQSPPQQLAVFWHFSFRFLVVNISHLIKEPLRL